jgi:tetratricopeptide (TPR) repeat protein
MTIFSVGVYGSTAKPYFYKQFIDLGNKYLQEGKYQEAILEFTKAIKIEPKSTVARVGKAKGYIATDKIDEAIKVLSEAQNIAPKDEKLILEIINLLKDVDPQTAYNMLQKYLKAIGQDKASETIKELLRLAQEDPAIPNPEPPPGVYIKPVSVKFTSDKARLGHSIHYTTDGNEPSKYSKVYNRPIPVNEGSVTIKFFVMNPKGLSTAKQELIYTINPEMKNQLESVINESSKIYQDTKEGTEVGNCITGAKEQLKSAIDKGKDMLLQPVVTSAQAEEMKNILSNELNAFKQKIIVPTDRSALTKEINNAKQLLNGATEGSSVGQYRTGAKSKLQAAINKASTVLNNLIARQSDIDNARQELTNAINRFKNSKINEVDYVIAATGAKVGPVTVSLLWNSTDDLDLHVISPRGDEVFFENNKSSSGGILDIDRQVNSFVSNPVENIYWSHPPSGTYTVKVNVYTKRSSGNIPFKVRVINGGETNYYNLYINSGSTIVCKFNY